MCVGGGGGGRFEGQGGCVGGGGGELRGLQGREGCGWGESRGVGELRGLEGDCPGLHCLLPLSVIESVAINVHYT